MSITKYKNKYRIQSTRLKDWDYSTAGAYFVTICTKDRTHRFGEIAAGKLVETEQSRICQTVWDNLPNHYVGCYLDAFVIMPNHVHGILLIKPVETGLKPVSTDSTRPIQHSLSEITRGFKTFAARRINEIQHTPGVSFWQSRFYDRIIRDDEELNRIREYILTNPVNWDKDENNISTPA